MTHKNLLKILFVEDLPSDVDLAVLELRKEGLRFEHIRVDTREEFIKSLNEFRPDIIISDYMMPSYNGMRALKDAREFDPLIPFILFTGSMNEETAVDCIKAGATDYIIKEHMTRLPYAVKEALEQHRIKVEKRASDLLLKENEEKLQSIFSAAPVGIGLVVNRVFMEVNDTFCTMTGYTRKELIGKSAEMIYVTKEEYESVGIDKYGQIAEKGIGSVETRFKCKDGRILNVFLNSTPLDKDNLLKGVTFTVMDITGRKNTEEALTQEKYLIYSLMDTLHDHIYFKDLKSRFIRINKAHAQFFRLDDPSQAVGKTDFDFFTSEHARQAYEDEQTIIRTSRPMSLEERETHPDRSDTWVSTVKMPLHDKDGNVIGTFGISRDITERKLTEIALNKSEERFRNLYNDAVIGLYRTNPQGAILMANHTLIKMLGFSSFEELSKRNLNKTGYEPVYKRRQFIDQIEKEGEVKEMESVWICSDGKEIFVRENAKAIYDFEGKILYYDGTVVDITEQKRTTEDLNKIQHLFETLALVSPVGIFRTDTDGNTTYVNPKWSELSGLSSEEAIGNGWIKAVHPEDRQKLSEAWLNNLRLKDESGAEYRFLKPDGSIVWVIGKAVPELIGNEVTGYIGTITDITKRKFVEEELKKNQAQLLNAHIIAHLGSWEYDVENDTFIFNDPFYAIYRTTAEQVGGYTMKSADYAKRFVHPEDMDMVGLETRKAIETDDPDFNRQLEHRIIYADGETGYITVRFFIVKNTKGETVRTYGVNQDITERRRAEVELLKAAEQMKLAKEKAEAGDRMKTTFLNNISHEVRTPLNGILGFSEIVSQPGLNDVEKKAALSMLTESSDRLLSTITNYIDISLISSNSVSIRKKDFSPRIILNDLYERFRKKCSSKNIDLELHTVPETLLINSDPETLQKIFTHLLDNAVKFTEKGSIEFGYRIRENRLELFVTDTGIGIGKEYQEGIFGYFVKEDHGPMIVTEGSGLGLSISKGFVDLLGGRIWVESEKGKGSGFFFTLPHIINEGVDFKHTGNELNMKKGTLNSILIAEDDKTNYFYLKTVLSKFTSARIIHASNGREAIELFRANPDIGLILMDIKMPEIDGLDATRQIKMINKDIVVIAITAFAMLGDREKIIEAGCNDYLSKPVNKKILFEKISKYITV